MYLPLMILIVTLILVRGGAARTTVGIPTPPIHEVTIKMEPMIDDVTKKVCELSLQKMVMKLAILLSYVDFKPYCVSKHHYKQ